LKEGKAGEEKKFEEILRIRGGDFLKAFQAGIHLGQIEEKIKKG